MMLENLRLPVVATGTLNVDARLKDAGKLTQLDLDAKLGDITAKIERNAPALSDCPARTCGSKSRSPMWPGLRQVFDVDWRAGRGLDGQRARRVLARGNQARRR